MYRITVYFTEDNAALALFLANTQDLPGIYGIYTAPYTARFISRMVSSSMSPHVTRMEIYVDRPDGARDALLTSGLSLTTNILIEKIDDVF